MCRKRKRDKRYSQPPMRRNPGIADVEAVLQLLRIRLWQIIARNNSEELIDPLVKPLKNPMPYVQNAQSAQQDDDIANIKPTLDEVLPLPKKAEEKGDKQKYEEKVIAKSVLANGSEKSSSEKKAAKKTSAQDLVVESDELPGQMTVDEAIAQAEGKETQSQCSAPTDTNLDKNVTAKSSEQEKVTEPKQEHVEKQPKKQSLLDRYRTWKMDRADRNDYFDKLEVQVKNKNAACFELLDYLDKLQEDYQ